MSVNDMADDIRDKAKQIASEYGLKLSDPELNELVEHLVAFEGRVDTIRRVKLEHTEEPALKLFVDPPGGIR
jgi:hypothetical protein